MEQWSPQPGRNWGAPTILPLGQELPSFLSREVPRGRNQVKMRERNLRNAEEAGWLCREAWAEGRGCLPHVGSAPRSVLCLPAGEGVCLLAKGLPTVTRLGSWGALGPPAALAECPPQPQADLELASSH